jgi:hypothetical protein
MSNYLRTIAYIHNVSDEFFVCYDEEGTEARKE